VRKWNAGAWRYSIAFRQCTLTSCFPDAWGDGADGPLKYLASHVLVMLLLLQNPGGYREDARTAAECRRGLSLRACFTIRGCGEIAMMSLGYGCARGPSWGNYIKRP
jgi:hypothetical protein